MFGNLKDVLAWKSEIKAAFIDVPGDPSVGIDGTNFKMEISIDFEQDAEFAEDVRKMISKLYSEILDEYCQVVFDIEMDFWDEYYRLNKLYPYIRAWGQSLQSNNEYIMQEQLIAEHRGAPFLAISRTENDWSILGQIQNSEKRRSIRRLGNAIYEEARNV